MKKKYIKLLNLILLFMVGIFIVVGWVVADFKEYSVFHQEGVLVSPDEVTKYDDGSRMYTINLNSPSEEYNGIKFYTNHQQVYVYSDDALVYSVEKDTSIYGRTSGSVMNFVRIPYGCNQIKIITKPTFDDIGIADLEIFIGDGVTLYEDSLRETIPAMLICLLIMAIGFCLVIYYYMISRDKENFREILCLGLFSMLLGAWAFGETPGAHLLITNRVMASYNAFFLIAVMNVPFICFIKYFLGVKNKKLHRYGIFAITADLVIVTVLQVAGIRDVKQNALFIQLTVVISSVYFIYAIVKALKRRRFYHRAMVNVIGAFVIIFTIAIDMVAYYKDVMHANQISKFGFLIYIIVLAAETARESRITLEQANKARFYREMAITDQLTDCYNRNAFSEDFDKLDVERTTVDIIEFDLNNLKLCNDTKGHHAGDEYIKGAASLIKDTFAEYGKVYRMGGDEFCVILKNKEEDLVKELVDKLRLEERKFYEDAYKLDMAVACGYARYDKSIDSNLEDTLKRADQNMYIDKKKIKGIKE